jgi:hypothetical protein
MTPNVCAEINDECFERLGAKMGAKMNSLDKLEGRLQVVGLSG